MWNFLISSFVEYVNIRKGQFSERMLWLFAFTELIRVFTLRKILPVKEGDPSSQANFWHLK